MTDGRSQNQYAPSISQLFLGPWVAGVSNDYIYIYKKKKEYVSANEGLHSGRQWYLFVKIRPFFSSQSTDSVCFKLIVPKPTHVVK